MIRAFIETAIFLAVMYAAAVAMGGGLRLPAFLFRAMPEWLELHVGRLAVQRTRTQA
jgi:hypothetical protein